MEQETLKKLDENHPVVMDLEKLSYKGFFEKHNDLLHIKDITENFLESNKAVKDEDKESLRKKIVKGRLFDEIQGHGIFSKGLTNAKDNDKFYIENGDSENIEDPKNIETPKSSLGNSKSSDTSHSQFSGSGKTESTEKRNEKSSKSLLDDYFQVEANNKTYFRDRETNKNVLVDIGPRINIKRSRSKDMDAVMELAIQKGWSSIKVHGSNAFKSELTRRAQTHGLIVTNHQAPYRKSPDLEKSTSNDAVKELPNLGRSLLPKSIEKAKSAELDFER